MGTVIDRDAGDWVDTNGNGTCEVGTSAEPSDEIVWHNAGTTSQTSRRLICWLYGPDGQRDRLHTSPPQGGTAGPASNSKLTSPLCVEVRRRSAAGWL